MGTLDINSIRDYLIEVGCKVEYPILVNAFKKHLYNPDPDIQSTVRTQFKDYVNRLSTVNVENNMKFITLRPEFRPASFNLASGQHDGQATTAIKQQRRESQSPTPPLPPPLQTSSPKRSPPMSANNSKQPPVAPQGTQELISGPFLQSGVQDQRNAQARSDRLDSPRNPPAHFQSPPIQGRRQHTHQATPRPPLTSPHQKMEPAHVMSNMHAPPRPPPPPPQMVSSPSRPQNAPEPPDGQHVDEQTQRYFPQQHQHYRSRSHPEPMASQQSVQRSHQTPSSQRQLQQPAHKHLGANRDQDHPRPPLNLVSHNSNNNINHNGNNKDSTPGSDATMMPPPPVPAQLRHRSPLARQSSSLQTLDTVPPPRPPPRRRQSTASLCVKPSPNKSIDKTGRDMQDLARKSLVGRVRDHQAHRSYSSASTNDLSPFVAKRNSSMKENRSSRESNLNNLSSSFQSIGFARIKRSRSSHRGEDESDSSSLQPNDPLRRKWTMEASSCNYNNLLLLLREDPKLAFCKDIMNGYTALHWAAKFGNLEIIRLIAGTYGVSVNIKSSAGQTPLHVAYMFSRMEAVNLLLQSYQASTEVRDHSGKRPMQYWQKPSVT